LEAEPDDEITHEVELSVLAREQTLADLGIDSAMFEAALLVALDEREALAAREDVRDDEIPPLEEMMLFIGGIAYKLEELADLEVRGWDA